MKRRLCTCVALLFAALECAHAQADIPLAEPGFPGAGLAAAARDRAEGLIKLDVMVTDAAGKPAAGLNASDFRLLENGREQKIISFDAFNGRGTNSEPPVKIILLIDTMELPPDLAHDERNAVMAWLRKDHGHLGHPVSVFSLSDSGLWAPAHPSADGNTLAREIEHNDFTLVRPNLGWKRGSAPSAGDPQDSPSESALKALGQIATDERRRPGRKLLAWVGPGWGVGSGAYVEAKTGAPSAFEGESRAGASSVFGTVCWFSALLREARLALYSFTVGENPSTNRGHIEQGHTEFYKAYLDGVRAPQKASFTNLHRKVLAIQSGGRVMDESVDLEREIESIVQEAGPFYRITFDPLPAEQLDEYHDLKLEVDERDLSARTNSGFYDQPYYSTDPIPPPKRVSLEELQKLLEADESDAEKAKHISGLELTKRLSERRLAAMYDIAHGKRTRQELRILADASAFLEPPADEIPNAPPPDADEQRRMLAMTRTYLTNTIHKLPDLFALETTARYQETPMYLEANAGRSYQPLHAIDGWTTTIRYRNGSEVAETKPPKRRPKDPQLLTYGVFGPALNGVLDAVDKQSGLTWIRWELGDRGPVAVFRFSVAVDKSRRQEWLCCLPDGDGTLAFQRYAAYHEEIAIDPESGAIVRLALQTDLLSTTPSTRSDVMIEYGPVDIGGTKYICPLRSVSIMRARSVKVMFDWDESFRTFGPYSTMLNDMSFDRYHIFRSESRVLTGFTPDEK